MTRVGVARATVSERLARYARELRFEDLPTAVVDKTIDHLVYHIALALGGHDAPSGSTAVRLAHQLSAGVEAATIIGARRRAMPLDAALANSGLIATGHLDDTVEPSGLHPGIVVYPAVLAIGETQRVPGRELITAIVLGYDVMAKLADPVDMLGNYARRPNYVFGPFGVAAATARLLGLDEDSCVHALGHAGHAGMGVVEGTEFAWAVEARIARGGMLSALLAKAGAPSARTTIEGAHGTYRAFCGAVPAGLEASLDTLGSHFAITEATTKPFSASGVNIIALQLALEMRTSGAFTADDVADVRVVVADERRVRDEYFEGEMDKDGATADNAKGSLRFRIACVLLDGRIDLSRCESFRAPEVQHMLRRVHLAYEGGHVLHIAGTEAPNSSWARVEITTRDGRTHAAARERFMAPRGDWRAWLHRDGERLLSAVQLDRLEQLFNDLADVDDISEVMACLRPPEDPRAS